MAKAKPELDITVEEIIAVAQAALRGQSLKDNAAAIRQYMDEALMSFSVLDGALQRANLVHEASGTSDVKPEDRKVVDAAEAYVKAENRLLLTLLTLAEESGPNTGFDFATPLDNGG